MTSRSTFMAAPPWSQATWRDTPLTEVTKSIRTRATFTSTSNRKTAGRLWRIRRQKKFSNSRGSPAVCFKRRGGINARVVYSRLVAGASKQLAPHLYAANFSPGRLHKPVFHVEVVMRQKNLKKCSIYLIAFFALLALPSKGALRGREAESGLRFGISFPAELGPSALDGRVLLMIATDGSQEPRMQINDGPKTQQIFGIDVEGLKPGQQAFIDGAVFGYPRKSLREIPAGTYWIQALLHKYETFKRSDGH